jgi:hypothetical protein
MLIEDVKRTEVNSNGNASTTPPLRPSSPIGIADVSDQLNGQQEAGWLSCIWGFFSGCFTSIRDCLTGLFTFGQEPLSESQVKAEKIWEFIWKWYPEKWAHQRWDPEVQGQEFLNELNALFSESEIFTVKASLFATLSDNEKYLSRKLGLEIDIFLKNRPTPALIDELYDQMYDQWKDFAPDNTPEGMDERND